MHKSNQNSLQFSQNTQNKFNFFFTYQYSFQSYLPSYRVDTPPVYIGQWQDLV